MKRIINFRPLFLAFVGLSAGILLSAKYFCGDNLPVYLLGGLFIILLSVYILSFFKFAKILKLVRVSCLILYVSAAIGMMSFAVFFDISSSRPLESRTCQVTGRIGNVVTDGNTTKLLLSNLVIDDVEYNFNIMASTDGYYSENILEIGNYLSFTGYFYENPLIRNDEINTYSAINKVYYYCYINSATVTYQSGGRTIFENIRLKTETFLNENMSEDSAGVCLAVLIGNRNEISDPIQNVFDLSGITHILSVSGLHVTFIVMMLVYFLNKLRLKGLHTFIIVVIILSLYCALCGFFPPVIRSAIMSICLLFSLITGKRSDGLSAVSFAGILLLLLNPFYLFDIGFMLSFMAVFSMILLHKQITGLLVKIKIPVKIAGMLALTLSAQIGTIPIIAKYFGNVAVASLLSNLVIIPVFGLFYMLLFIAFLLNLILPLGFLFFPLDYVLKFILNISAIFAKLGVVKLPDFNFATGLLYYLFIFAVSRYVMMSFKNKIAVSACLTVMFFTIFTLSNTAVHFNHYTLSTIKEVENTLILTTNANKKFLINIASGDKYDIYNIERALSKMKIKKLSGILVLNYTDEMQNSVCELSKNYSVENLYLPLGLENSTMLGLAGQIHSTGIINFVDFSDYEISLDCSVTKIVINSSFKAVKIKIGNENFVMIINALTLNQSNILLPQLSADEVKAIFIEKYSDGISNLLSLNADIISKEICPSENIFCSQNYNLWTLTLPNDTI